MSDKRKECVSIIKCIIFALIIRVLLYTFFHVIDY